MANLLARTSLAAKPIYYKTWHDGDKVYTSHNHERKCLSWGTPIEEKLIASQSGSGITYAINHDMHYLEAVYMKWQTKPIRVKSECSDFVRIAYTPLLMHNIIKTAELQLDTIKTSMDSKIMDICADIFMKPDMRQDYMFNAGNNPALTSWATELQSETLETPQWWHFCGDPFDSIPIFLVEKDKIKFHYDFHTDLSKLLRMKVHTKSYRAYVDKRDARGKSKVSLSSSESKINGSAVNDISDDGYEWEEIPLDSKSLVDEKTDIGGFPELFARYSYREQAELADWKECKEGKARVYNILEFKQLKSDNTTAYGSNAIAVGENIKLPIKRVVFLAENVKSRENRNYSNYSTDVAGLDGMSPCSNWSLTVGNIQKFKDAPCRSSRFLSAWYGRGISLKNPGIHVQEFCGYKNSHDNTESLSASDGKIKLSVKIDVDNRSVKAKGDEFDLLAYLHLSRDIEYRAGKDGKWSIVDSVDTI